MNIICVPVGPLQGNCYLVWDDKRRACAVDPGGEPQLLADVASDRDLTLSAVLVTHGHFDHVEGVAGLVEATGAAVYCSETVVPIVAKGKECSATGRSVPSVEGAAVNAVKDGSEFAVGDLSVRVIATPGHTPGDVTYDIDGDLFCGDLLFQGSVGRTDFPGGDFGALLASIGRLVDKYGPDTSVYPGHMDQTTLGQELKHNPFLLGLRSDG